ncbi:glycoside hydrolase family 3 N-terminal domain-containing protein [Candidatus Xianfuyuplasma coldseepsis]|uniref:beta-glucosidase n=1 Tax=Candidatus Xianfuyuplasma coldseepsis TaxID=2782163 RepID=A0A7L7KQI4_9MOLU|nr:glycoside hydrolase family 3 N-terminal domain-containing protein [Xianfuyuplasma coldseepsis]QMS85061.1 beta-glucosidase [Xianfuyuplasma coldseepsis]
MRSKETILEEMKHISRDPLPKRSDASIKKDVESLLKRMNLQEKIGQMYLSAFSHEFAFGPDFEKNNSFQLIRDGLAGNFVGTYDNEIAYELQRTAVHETRLGIPLIFMNDIIHGCRTGFPINLALSGTFNPQLIQQASEIIAYESSHSGTSLTFSPMLDIVQDPRWGRVMESPGEDPFLASEMAKAYVKGFQQDNLLSYDTMASCLKHFVGYGKSEAGRDYNTVDMSERMLRQVYLQPFKAGLEAGASMIMSGFNLYDGVPVSANAFLLRTILRDEYKFDGVTISDYASTTEVVEHKLATTKKDAAKLCVKAGLNMEIISSSYIDHLDSIVEEDPEFETYIDEAVRYILTLKYRLGLFDNPYKNLYPNFEEYYLQPRALEHALKVAEESLVLLENNGVLPLKKDKKIALIGPFAASHHVVGGWGGKARNEDTVTLLDALQESGANVNYAEGCSIKEIANEQLEEALDVASTSDVIVLAFGEHQWESGEASSKTILDVYDAQLTLAKELKTLEKPIIAILFSGRPLLINWYAMNCDALINSWFLGTMSGPALTNTLFGDNNPSGRLAMSFPRSVGQIPVYYNHFPTGRPAKDPNNYYTSKYLDSPNTPLYSFGYGLSYSTFEYSNYRVSQDTLREGEQLTVSCTVSNTSNYDGYDVLQLYIEAESFSVSRPVLELKQFKKVFIKAHTSLEVTLQLPYESLSYYNIDMNDVVEQRRYHILLGRASNAIHFQATIATK